MAQGAQSDIELPHLFLKLALRWLVIIIGGCALTAQKPSPIFVEVPPSSSGIHWVHDNARSAKRYLPETMSGGVAVFDYDNDGWMDIFLANSGSSSFFKPPKPLKHGLFRNQQNGTFADMTVQAGLTFDLFSMGVAAADYDGDKCVDLLVTGYAASALFRNRCNGTFENVTDKSGVNPPGWSTSAVWLDYDNDGKLDLYVLQFLDYSSLQSCTAVTAYGGSTEVPPRPDQKEFRYCSPINFPPTTSHLYRNRGDGTFEDVSERLGIAAHKGKGLGVVATDINNDGWIDLFHANDMEPNFLFVNRNGKRFEERGIESGVAYSQDGQVRSGMGVDTEDVDGDGRQDLFVANIDQQMFSLYRNDGDELFTDVSGETGIARDTRMLSGWGLRFLDYDNDGLLDLILANGHPDDQVGLRLSSVTYDEQLLLFRGTGKGMMRNVSHAAGSAFGRTYPARGLAVGDFNNDGYPDVVVANNGKAPLLLRNGAASGNTWVGLALQPSKSNPAAIGTMIRWQAGGVVRSGFVRGGGSYLSSHDPRVILGLGKAKADWVEVRWPSPSTSVDRISNPPVGKYLAVVEGKHH